MGILIEDKQDSSQRSPYRLIFHGSMWFGLAIVVNRLLPGILVVILAWWLEPKELGVISFVLACYAILLPIADWSIAYALQKLIPEDGARARQISWTALLMRLMFSAVLGTFCWVLDVTKGVFHGYGLYLALLLVSSAFGTVVYIHNALRNFAKGSLYSIGVPIVWVGVALALAKGGMHITGPLLGLFFSFMLFGIYTVLGDSALRGGISFLRPVASEILRFGLWATLAVVLSSFADQVGILIVDYLKGDAAAAVFKVAATFGLVPALLGMIVVLPLMPVARVGMLNGHNVGARLIRPLFRHLLLLGLPIAAAGFVLAPAVIGTFTRHSYMAAVWPLRIILGGNLLRTLVTAMSGILFVGDGLRALVRIYGAMAAVSLIGGVILTLLLGITGMAVAFLASGIVGVVLISKWFWHTAPIHLEWNAYLRQSFSAALTAAVAYSGVRLVHPAFGQLLLGGCLAGVVYSLLLWLQRDLAFLSLLQTLRNYVVG